jgi:glycosyltransferase involved in cell wall biosynthesis
MHQYTADLANRMARAGHGVHVVTTVHYPRDRYHGDVTVHTPVDTRDSGLSPGAMHVSAIRDVSALIRRLQPDLVHFTGPHIWNIPVLSSLRRAAIPTIHTLHDLDPHAGTSYGALLHFWNRLVLHLADHILVHGTHYRERLIARGLAPARVTYTPLLHLFLGQGCCDTAGQLAAGVRYEPLALFFGRLERYKGVGNLIAAWAMVNGSAGERPRLVLAGPGRLEQHWAGALPAKVEVRNRWIADEEAIDLFQRCAVLVLPYRDATQSALVASAYFFRKPVIVTRSGALAEYVQDGRTGWIVEPDHPPSLARCLVEALSDTDRLAAMGATGRAWYDQQREAEEETLLQLYGRVASRARQC